MEYLRVWQVSRKTTMSKSQIWEEAKEGRFPQPISLSPRVTVWIEAEIDSWMEKKKENFRKKYDA